MQKFKSVPNSFLEGMECVNRCQYWSACVGVVSSSSRQAQDVLAVEVDADCPLEADVDWTEATTKKRTTSCHKECCDTMRHTRYNQFKVKYGTYSYHEHHLSGALHPSLLLRLPETWETTWGKIIMWHRFGIRNTLVSTRTLVNIVFDALNNYTVTQSAFMIHV